MSEAPGRDRRPLRPWLRRLLTAVGAIVLGVLVAVTVYGTSVQPGAAIVKSVFEAKPEVTPPTDFTSIESTVSETRDIVIVPAGAPEARLNVYRPKDASGALPVILWIHGGGFISSSADTVRDFAIMLAHSGYLVANLDYTLAPGAHYPVPVQQGDAALAYVNDHAAALGADTGRVAIGGDSAGAQIASELGVVETDPAFAERVGISPALAAGQLDAVVLYCGLYDMGTVGATGFPALRTYLSAYTGQQNWEGYDRLGELSTTRNATSSYPATFLTVGDADPFRTQADGLDAALTSRGTPVTYLNWVGSGAGLGHEYQFDFTASQAQTAYTETTAFLAERLGR